MYFTRGYVFQTYDQSKQRTTSNYGVRVKGDIDFYGVLKEIIEVEYPGLVNLKCVLFRCDWFDPTVGRGVRLNKFGVVDVNESRRYNKFEPFILASQAEQVTFVPYPRVRKTGIPWISVINVSPRGRIIENNEIPPMQQATCTEMTSPNQQIEDIILIDTRNEIVEDLADDTDQENNEDDEFAESDEQSEAGSEES